ncbi:MAG: CHAT domain-containing protein [Pseudonocardiales bacterium]|nr:CHAT domain-containing protein [Pseudonocardiales bacterium]
MTSIEEITPSLWATLTGTTFRSNAVGWAELADGRRLLISGSKNGYSHLWDIRSGEPRQLFAQHEGAVIAVACATTPSGQLLVATGGMDWVARVWDARGHELYRLDGHAGPVHAVAWAVLPQGRALLASGSDDATVRVWDGETGRALHRLPVGLNRVHPVYSVACAVLPTGQPRLAAVAPDDAGQGVVYLWDGLTGARLHTLSAPPGDVGRFGSVWGCIALAVGPDGRLLVATNAGAAAHVWDGETGEPLYVMNGVQAEALCWARMPAGDLVLLVAAESRIIVLDSGTGREVTAIDVVNDGYFRSFAATSASDGATLLAAAWKRDTPARIWRIACDTPASGNRAAVSIRAATSINGLDELAERVHRRISEYLASQDTAVLLEPAAERDARALWRAIRANDPHSEVIEGAFVARVRLGWLHFYRHTKIKGEPGWPELARAVVCLAPYAAEPDVIPRTLEHVLGPRADPDAQAGFAMGFLTLSKQLDDPALLDAGISLLVPAAAALPDDDPDRVTGLSNLCLALRSRFQRDGTADDLAHAITVGEQAVAIPGMQRVDPVGPRFNLSCAYHARFEHGRAPADILRAIGLLEDVTASFGPGPQRSTWLTEFARACMQLYEHTGEPAPLARAIDTAERAVAALPDDPKEAASALSTLGGALFCRYERDGTAEDLRRATELGQRCLASLPDRHPARADYLINVAGFHLRLHSSGLDAEGLRTACELSEQALAARPDSPAALSIRIAVLQERYRFAGNAADLDSAIRLGNQARSADLDDHQLRSVLAGAHLNRYQHAGLLDDLEQAIDIWRTLLAEAAGDRGERVGWASLLGNAYQQRFTSSHDLADLDRAIHFGEQAVAATSATDSDLGDSLGKLALTYQRGHEAGADPGHRARAIELGEQAVAVTPEGHQARAGWLSNLASAYLTHGYTADPTRADLDRAVDLSEQALAAHPTHQAGRVRMVANLAVAYRDRLAVSGPGVDVARLQELARHVVETDAVPVDRVWGRHAVGTLAQAAGKHRLATELLDTAVALLPDVAPQQAGWADQQYRLGEHQGLVGAAVAAHCALADLPGAVEVAELGRGVLLARQAEARTDLTELKRTHPTLADLRGAVAGGSVVLVNASRYRSDAVIVRAESDALLVELPGLHLKEVEERAIALTEATTDDGTSHTAALRNQRVLQEVLGWLWDSIAAPVLAALPAEPTPHRIWWLPTGFLSVFPLHAAGHMGQQGVLDAAVSSYIPTLRTLRDAHTRAAASTRRQLVVALHHTPGLPDLPGTANEAADLHARHFGTSLSDEQATTAQVLAALPEATWAHFACHANADLLSPAEGGLWLHDGPLRLPQIAALRLPHAELAYLSACSTAHHGGRHADETLHLASAFHLAGFRHVIASLWPLNDHVAVEAARGFYTGLPDTPTADTAAATLHRVTHALRTAEPTQPGLWAALIHSGP